MEVSLAASLAILLEANDDRAAIFTEENPDDPEIDD